MSRKPINWTDERIAKAKTAISTGRVVKFRNEPGIVFDKETGWFLTNPDVVGILLTAIKLELLPDDMSFQEPEDEADYEYISLALSSEKVNVKDGRYWAFGNGDKCYIYTSSNIAFKLGYDLFVVERKKCLNSIKVVYVDKTHEDCGFKNTPAKDRLLKLLDLFIKLNLYPYLRGDDDNYELSEGDALNPDNTPVVNMQLVHKTAEMIAPIMALAKPIIEGMELTAAETEELKKLIF